MERIRLDRWSDKVRTQVEIELRPDLARHVLIRLGNDIELLFPVMLFSAGVSMSSWPSNEPHYLLSGSIENQIEDRWKENFSRSQTDDRAHYRETCSRFNLSVYELERKHIPEILKIIAMVGRANVAVQWLNFSQLYLNPIADWDSELARTNNADDESWRNDLKRFLQGCSPQDLSEIRILIIGSGWGLRKQMVLDDVPGLSPHNIINLDVNLTEGIKPDLNGDATRLPFGNETMDIVIDPGVRSYKVLTPEGADRVLQEVRRVLRTQTSLGKPTGLYLNAPMVFSVFHPERPFRHPRIYFESLGFHVESMSHPSRARAVTRSETLSNTEYCVLIKRSDDSVRYILDKATWKNLIDAAKTVFDLNGVRLLLEQIHRRDSPDTVNQIEKFLRVLKRNPVYRTHKFEINTLIAGQPRLPQSFAAAILTQRGANRIQKMSQPRRKFFVYVTAPFRETAFFGLFLTAGPGLFFAIFFGAWPAVIWLLLMTMLRPMLFAEMHQNILTLKDDGNISEPHVSTDKEYEQLTWIGAMFGVIFTLATLAALNFLPLCWSNIARWVVALLIACAVEWGSHVGFQFVAPKIKLPYAAAVTPDSFSLDSILPPLRSAVEKAVEFFSTDPNFKDVPVEIVVEEPQKLVWLESNTFGEVWVLPGEVSSVENRAETLFSRKVDFILKSVTGEHSDITLSIYMDTQEDRQHRFQPHYNYIDIEGTDVFRRSTYENFHAKVRQSPVWLIPRALETLSERVLKVRSETAKTRENERRNIWAHQPGTIEIVTGYNPELSGGGGIVEEGWEKESTADFQIEKLLQFLEPKIVDKIKRGNILLQGPGHHLHEILMLMEKFPQATIHVLDISWKNLAWIKTELDHDAERYADRVKLYHADIRKMPFENASMDAGFSTSVIELRGLASDTRFPEIKRVLTPSGIYLTLGSPQHEFSEEGFIIPDALKEADSFVAALDASVFKEGKLLKKGPIPDNTDNKKLPPPVMPVLIPGFIPIFIGMVFLLIQARQHERFVADRRKALPLAKAIDANYGALTEQEQATVQLVLDEIKLKEGDDVAALSNDLAHMRPQGLEKRVELRFMAGVALEIKKQLTRVTDFRDNLASAFQITGRVPVLLFLNEKTSAEQIKETFQQVADQNNTWLKRFLNGITRRSMVICVTIEPSAQSNPHSILDELLRAQTRYKNARSIEKAAGIDFSERDYRELLRLFKIEIGTRIVQVNKPEEDYTIDEKLLPLIVLVTDEILLDFQTIQLAAKMA